MTLFHRRKLTIFGLALAVLSLHVHAVQQSLCSTQNSGSGYAAVTDIYQSESACSATCTGYAYAVLQYQQCWCSNYTPSDTTDISKCNQNCPGWPYEQCGSATSRLYGYVALGQSPLGTIGASGTQISSNTEPTTSVILTSVVVVTSTQVTIQKPTPLLPVSSPPPNTVTVQITTAVLSVVTSVVLQTPALPSLSSAPPPPSSQAPLSSSSSAPLPPSSQTPFLPISSVLPPPSSRAPPSSFSSAPPPPSSQAPSLSTAPQLATDVVLARPSSSSTFPTSTSIPSPIISIITISGNVVTQVVTYVPIATAIPPSLAQAPLAVPVETNNGLSSGAIAGITIGALAGAALIAALLFFFLFWRPRKQRREDAESGVRRSPSTLSKAGLLGFGNDGAGSRQPPRIQTTGIPSRDGSASLTSPTSPTTPMSESRRTSRPMFVDQRLNPNALMPFTNQSRTSVGTLQDEKDYSRPLEVRNPDLR